MATDSRRQLIWLALLAVVLAGVVWWQLSPEPASPSSASPARTVARATTRRGQASAAGVEPVRLDVLGVARTTPADERRDPFRFRTQAAPPPPQLVSRSGEDATGPAAQAAFRPVPTGPPPMLVKFIGILKPTSASPIAVLSDGKNVFYGREGETVDGRYRIQRIGVESIEMEWADGRGRQVIRLSGS